MCFLVVYVFPVTDLLTVIDDRTLGWRSKLLKPKKPSATRVHSCRSRGMIYLYTSHVRLMWVAGHVTPSDIGWQVTSADLLVNEWQRTNESSYVASLLADVPRDATFVTVRPRGQHRSTRSTGATVSSHDL